MAEGTTRWIVVAALLLLTAGLAGCMDDGGEPADDEDEAEDGEPPEHLEAALQDTEGEPVGTVVISEMNNSARVVANVTGLDPGFHGFHLHEVGDCAPEFTAAGGHHNPDEADHGDHAGDMPVLLVNADGTGELAFLTDRVTIGELVDDNGTAVIVHEAPDNYANIPERYGGPDEETLSTGDAGPRVACGALEAGEGPLEISPVAPSAGASLIDPDGEEVGTVSFAEADEGLTVIANVTGLSPGFHGFHLHETGACEPDFSLAGGHHNPDEADHGDHAGDMPVLLVTEEERSSLRFTTDRVTMDDLMDLDGTAVVVHELADNYANIPERYDGPDDETNAAGDAGARVACGPVEGG